MQERHTNRQKYFKEQEFTTRKHVIPFVENHKPISKETSVLEIGCGEGGNLKAFLDLGCTRVVGIDLAGGKIDNARKFFADHLNKKNIQFIHSDIYDVKDIGQFDIIITRDVLEHIHGQERFMLFVKKLLKPDGKFYLGFPPWHNPFGGHQQICENKLLSKLPYFHILPASLYKFILKSGGESDAKIAGLLEIKETGITIERFERIAKNTNYKINSRLFFSINPNYEIKFGLKPRQQLRFVSGIPYLRNFLITTNYYLISNNPKD